MQLLILILTLTGYIFTTIDIITNSRNYISKLYFYEVYRQNVLITKTHVRYFSEQVEHEKNNLKKEIEHNTFILSIIYTTFTFIYNLILLIFN